MEVNLGGGVEKGVLGFKNGRWLAPASCWGLSVSRKAVLLVRLGGGGRALIRSSIRVFSAMVHLIVCFSSLARGA